MDVAELIQCVTGFSERLAHAILWRDLMKITKLFAAITILLSTTAYAADTVDRSFTSAELDDVAGRVAGQCMSEGLTVIGQSPNQVTCQMPLDRLSRTLSYMRGRYAPSDSALTTYIKFNMAQVGQNVQGQAQVVTLGGDPPNPVAKIEGLDKAVTIFNTVQRKITHENQPFASSDSATSASEEALARNARRFVPEGVFLNSEMSLGDGTKRCSFSNGVNRVIGIYEDCWTK